MMIIVRSVIPLGQCVGCQIMYGNKMIIDNFAISQGNSWVFKDAAMPLSAKYVLPTFKNFQMRQLYLKVVRNTRCHTFIGLGWAARKASITMYQIEVRDFPERIFGPSAWLLSGVA